VNPLRAEIEALKKAAERSSVSVYEQQAENPHRHHCDHCGSSRLKRIGNRPNPTFKDLGVKDAVYQCADCSKESVFIIDG